MTPNKREATKYKGIYRIGDKRFEVRVALGKNPLTGKYGTKSELVTGSLNEARDRQDEIRKSARQRQVSITGWTVEQLMNKYFETARIEVSTESSDWHRWQVMRPGIGSTRVRSVTPMMIDELLDAVQKGRIGRTRNRLANSTINRYRSLLSAAFDMGQRYGIVGVNPVSATKTRTPEHIDRVAIRPELVIAALDLMDQHMPDTARFMVLTAFLGCRRSETCGLQVRDWNPERGELTICRGIKEKRGGGYVVGPTKAHNRRTWKIPTEAVAVIEERINHLKRGTGVLRLIQPEAFLFSEDGGLNPWRPRMVSDRWDRFRERVCPNCMKLAREKGICETCQTPTSIHLTTHNLRRFNTTTKLRAGVNPAHVQYTGGWKDLKTMLAHYADFLDEDDELANGAISSALSAGGK